MLASSQSFHRSAFHASLFSLLMLVSLALSACRSFSPAAGALSPYVPPTIAIPTQTPVSTVAATPIARQTAAPTCTNNLVYLEDLSIPDGSLVSPGVILDKRWQVENRGTCNWDEHYHLKLIAGQALGALEEQALYPARSGAPALIRIQFTAPQEPGSYRSAWQAYDPHGNAFGDPVFIDFIVQTP